MVNFNIYPIGEAKEYPRVIGNVILDSDKEMDYSYFSPLDHDKILVKAGKYEIIENYPETGARGRWARFTVKYFGLCVECSHSNAFCGNVFSTARDQDIGKEFKIDAGMYDYVFLDAVREGYLKIELIKPFSDYLLPLRGCVLTKEDALSRLKSNLTMMFYDYGISHTYNEIKKKEAGSEELGFSYPDKLAEQLLADWIKTGCIKFADKKGPEMICKASEWKYPCECCGDKIEKGAKFYILNDDPKKAHHVKCPEESDEDGPDRMESMDRNQYGQRVYDDN